MTLRRFLIDIALLSLLVLLGWRCYDRGKAYDFIVQNTKFNSAELSLPGMEAVQLSVDGGPSKTLYDGDTEQMVAVGSGMHKLRIDVLDPDDRPVQGQSKIFIFDIKELGAQAKVNIPMAYHRAERIK